MTARRELAWEGADNVRDLGGLPLVGGGETRFGRVLRSASVDGLTAAGWRALAEAGVSAVLDLRGEHEKVAAPLRPPGLATVTAPLEDVADPFFAEWEGRHASMDYFRAAMEHWPELWATAGSALASLSASLPDDSAVLVHCAAGRDRTGALASLILDAAGVERAAIVDEYVAGIEGSSRPAWERDAVLVDARDALPRFLDAPRPPALRDALGTVAARLL